LGFTIFKVGSRRVGQVLFTAIPGDHAGARIPHLHAYIGSGQVIIELLPGGDIRLSQAHAESIVGKVTANEVRKVMRTARDHYGILLALWKANQGE
jgi:hypothetical protein